MCRSPSLPVPPGVGHVYRQPKSAFHTRQSSFLPRLSRGRPACFSRGSAMPAYSRKRPPVLVGCCFHDITHVADLPVSQGGRPCRHAAGNVHQRSWDAVFMTSPMWPTSALSCHSSFLPCRTVHEKGLNPWQVSFHRDGSATKGTQKRSRYTPIRRGLGRPFAIWHTRE